MSELTREQIKGVRNLPSDEGIVEVRSAEILQPLCDMALRTHDAERENAELRDLLEQALPTIQFQANEEQEDCLESAGPLRNLARSIRKKLLATRPPEGEEVCMCGLAESEHDNQSEPIHTFTPMDEYYAPRP